MHRSVRGNSLVEFVLCFPVVAGMFLLPIQMQRLWFRQFTLERNAADVVRSLRSEPGDAVALQSLADSLVSPGVSVLVSLRPLHPSTVRPFRRTRTFEVVEVALECPSGVKIPGHGEFVCRARARELRAEAGPA